MLYTAYRLFRSHFKMQLANPDAPSTKNEFMPLAPMQISKCLAVPRLPTAQMQSIAHTSQVPTLCKHQQEFNKSPCKIPRRQMEPHQSDLLSKVPCRCSSSLLKQTRRKHGVCRTPFEPRKTNQNMSSSLRRGNPPADEGVTRPIQNSFKKQAWHLKKAI